ncbi:Major facilitator superfamily domain, general substrate transporter [Pseudocohnilembus persalinus]|uniref:Major facilitator superfamily domain, general substrate transporter n=1 Tax=Pseudocohnilembus persalinus TaxID=266149 RepID=A0A0V0R867_PSEPJ|nr:Major facilitator superfamily domain, general substrate transporter [Pseudocohnilembus persalinus]|eukprot:KRX10392.1 Major facilitator superfamily domain, general substrate transporter [Pseudocohnilembus persalinus]
MKEKIVYIYRIIGEKGRFQKRTTFFFAIHYFISAVFVISVPLLFWQPQFSCLNKKGVYEICYEDTGACDNDDVQINTNVFSSISAEFKLYCDKRNLRVLGQSLVYIGGAIGILIFNQLSDIKGRKISIILSWIIVTIGAVIMAFSQNIDLILFSIFLLGLGIFPITSIDQVYLNEVSTGKYRQTSQVLMYVVWGIAEIAILPLTEIINDWQTFILIYKSVRGFTLLFVLFSIFIHCLYYGTGFIISRVGLELRWNIFYIGIAETIGYYLSEIKSPYLKRKKGTIISIIISIIFMMYSICFTIPDKCQENHQLCWQKSAQILSVTLSRLTISFAFSLFILWINEILPTTIRSIGQGLILGLGIGGGFISPFIVDASYSYNINPVLTLSALGSLCIFLSICIKETKDVKPPDEIEEELQDDDYQKQAEKFEKRVIQFGPNLKDLVNGEDENQKKQNQSEKKQNYYDNNVDFQVKQEEEFKQFPQGKKL